MFRFRRKRPTPEQIRAESIAAIRAHIAALGFPLNHLTDEQIERCVESMTRSFAKMGMATAEMQAKMASAFRAINAAAR